jgi:hypothetical protein
MKARTSEKNISMEATPFVPSRLVNSWPSASRHSLSMVPTELSLESQAETIFASEAALATCRLTSGCEDP